MGLIVSPSLLSCNFLELQKELKAFDSISDIWFHLDIMDGHFVPNLTIGSPVVSLIQKATKHKLDAHFMVTNPSFYIDSFKDFGLHNFTFHWEASVHQDRLIQKIKDHYPSVGLSLNPATSPLLIPDYILQEVDLILIMTVNPGFGGQKFISSGLQKVEYFDTKRKELKAKFSIQVDGGVNAENAKELVKRGADNLVAGSYIFKDGPSSYKAKVESLRP